jgi:hypothetical protein
MQFDSNKKLNVLIPKGRFFRAILKYLLKDTSFLEMMHEASYSQEKTQTQTYYKYHCEGTQPNLRKKLRAQQPLV